MENSLEIGLKGHQEQIVTEEVTAAHLGSGTVRVFATPMMVSLMERTCRISVKPFLPEGSETVGTLVNITHEAATPVGAKVWCDSTLTGIDRRRLIFRVEVHDENGLVGQGSHERFIIDIDRFLGKAYSK